MPDFAISSRTMVKLDKPPWAGHADCSVQPMGDSSDQHNMNSPIAVRCNIQKRMVLAGEMEGACANLCFAAGPTQIWFLPVALGLQQAEIVVGLPEDMVGQERKNDRADLTRRNAIHARPLEIAEFLSQGQGVAAHDLVVGSR